MNYNLRYPTSQKSLYTSGDNIDLVMSFPSRGLVGNSVRITGILDVYSTGVTRVLPTDRIYYDAMVGVHSFMDNISVSMQTKGVIESITQYPRYVKMKNSAIKTVSQLATDSKLQCQLFCQDSYVTNSMMSYSLSFSCDLDMCLNNVIGNSVFGYSKTGDITISFRFVQPIDALFGGDMSSNVNYTVTSLACEYLTVMEPKELQPVQMIITYPVKQTINSTNASLNIKLPAIINSMYASFMLQAQESQMSYNNLALQQPAGIYKLYYSFNDTSNTFISYPVDSIEDMMERYLMAFKGVKNSTSLKRVGLEEIFGVGLDYEGQINMLDSSFGMNILSQVSNASPFSIFAFFKGIIAV